MIYCRITGLGYVQRRRNLLRSLRQIYILKPIIIIIMLDASYCYLANALNNSKNITSRNFGFSMLFFVELCIYKYNKIIINAPTTILREIPKIFRICLHPQSRVGHRWPEIWNWTGSGWILSINVGGFGDIFHSVHRLLSYYAGSGSLYPRTTHATHSANKY